MLNSNCSSYFSEIIYKMHNFVNRERNHIVWFAKQLNRRNHIYWLGIDGECIILNQILSCPNSVVLMLKKCFWRKYPLGGAPVFSRNYFPIRVPMTIIISFVRINDKLGNPAQRLRSISAEYHMQYAYQCIWIRTEHERMRLMCTKKARARYIELRRIPISNGGTHAMNHIWINGQSDTARVQQLYKHGRTFSDLDV